MITTNELFKLNGDSYNVGDKFHTSLGVVELRAIIVDNKHFETKLAVVYREHDKKHIMTELYKVTDKIHNGTWVLVSEPKFRVGERLVNRSFLNRVTYEILSVSPSTSDSGDYIYFCSKTKEGTANQEFVLVKEYDFKEYLSTGGVF